MSGAQAGVRLPVLGVVGTPEFLANLEKLVGRFEGGLCSLEAPEARYKLNPARQRWAQAPYRAPSAVGATRSSGNATLRRFVVAVAG
jgi:hypothetical protein